MQGRSLVLHRRHALAGAVFEESAGWTVPAAYGPDSFEREYAACREGVGIADLSDRGVLAVSGAPRSKFLQGILSNDVLGRRPGQGCGAALMTAKGHLTALLRVLIGPEAVWLECPPDRSSAVERALAHYKVATPVRFEARATAVLAILGPQARQTLGQAGSEVPEMALDDHLERAVAGRNVTVVRGADLPGEGFVLHVGVEGADDVWQSLVAAGAVPLGRRAIDARRVEAGRPWYGPDVTEENLLHETGLVAEYHSPTKGCYVGQEVVARLEARGGHVNKRLVGLQLGAPGAAGAEVSAGGEPVGRVTTAARSPRHGPIALGYLRRGHFEVGTTVEVSGGSATVVTLPFDAGR